MKLNHNELQAAKDRILKHLPAAELKVADQLIYRAIKLGFTGVSILPPIDPSFEPSIKDLVGTKDNVLYFLYGKI